MPKQKPTEPTLEAADSREPDGACDSECVIGEDPLEFDLYSEENRTSYKDGDKAALFRVLVHCALFRRAIPEWASEALDLSYRAALTGEIRSWDHVFGRPWQQERPRAQRRAVQTQARKWQVWMLVRALHEEEGKPPIDNILFERVAEQLGLGRSTVGNLYGQVERAVRRVRSSKG
jgi:hypothetical protein